MHTADGRALTSALSGRHRELLVYLALHPTGCTATPSSTRCGPTATPTVPAADALHAMLGRLRRAVHHAVGGDRPSLTVLDATDYRLDADLIDVDHWQFTTALAALRAATSPDARLDAAATAVAAYHGTLGAGLSTDWIDQHRDLATRDAATAHHTLARLLAATDPDRAIQLLRTACDLDPYNETLYTDLIHAHTTTGDHHAATATATLLARRMADLGLPPISTRNTHDPEDK